MKTRLLFIATFALLLGCSRDRTEYEIRYCFDNTDMHSDFLEAYELTSDTTGNGKWRSERHHLDTVIIDGDTVEWASGTLKDVARGNCVALRGTADQHIGVEGMRWRKLQARHYFSPQKR